MWYMMGCAGLNYRNGSTSSQMTLQLRWSPRPFDSWSPPTNNQLKVEREHLVGANKKATNISTAYRVWCLILGVQNKDGNSTCRRYTDSKEIRSSYRLCALRVCSGFHIIFVDAARDKSYAVIFQEIWECFSYKIQITQRLSYQIQITRRYGGLLTPKM